MNALFNLGLEGSRLSDLALRLGADVPFFLMGGTALGTGIGELLSPITFPMDYWIVLVNPGIPVSTKEVFTEFSKDLTRTRSPGNLAGRISADADLCDLLHNDLATAAERLFPQIGRLKRQLLGCGVQAVLMSGSGPTLFGIGSRTEVERAAREMPEGTVVALTRPISYGILID
jgi:4-diphosphocytidyl-2-C-methyl-D-erythritol kinase